MLLATTAHAVGAQFNWRRGLSGGSVAPGPSPVSRRLATAGCAVVVIVGGFGLLAIVARALGTS